MKLKSTFIVNKISGETVAVPVAGDFHGVVRTNETAGFIIDCLKNETGFDEVVEKMLGQYEVSREKAEDDLKKILDQLREIGAIEELNLILIVNEKQERRRLLCFAPVNLFYFMFQAR